MPTKHSLQTFLIFSVLLFCKQVSRGQGMTLKVITFAVLVGLLLLTEKKEMRCVSSEQIRIDTLAEFFLPLPASGSSNLTIIWMVQEQNKGSEENLIFSWDFSFSTLHLPFSHWNVIVEM